MRLHMLVLVAALLPVPAAQCKLDLIENVGRRQYPVFFDAYSRAAAQDGVQASYTSSTDGNNTVFSMVVRMHALRLQYFQLSRLSCKTN